MRGNKVFEVTRSRTLRSSDIETNLTIGRRRALTAIGVSTVGTTVMAVGSRRAYSQTDADKPSIADSPGAGRNNDRDSGRFADPAGGGTDFDVNAEADPGPQCFGVTDADQGGDFLFDRPSYPDCTVSSAQIHDVAGKGTDSDDGSRADPIGRGTDSD